MSATNRMFIDTRLPKSKAFLSLQLAASIQVLLIFYTKRRMARIGGKKGQQRYGVANNGEIIFTYKEAENYGITRPRFRRALNELIRKGFLGITEAGGGIWNTPARYKLLDNWLAYDKPGFKPGKRVEPTHHNPGFRKGNEHWRKRR